MINRWSQVKIALVRGAFAGREASGVGRKGRRRMEGKRREGEEE